MTIKRILRFGVLCLLSSMDVSAQSATDIKALEGLAPVTTLSRTSAGSAALGANFVVTGGIQNGVVAQSTLLPFAQQQQQALQDVFITARNLAQLADGLGTTLGSAYLARAHYVDRDHNTDLSQSVADVIAYACTTTQNNASSGKYFFANETIDGKKPVSAEAKAILSKIGGTPDMFGQAYGFPAGSPGADAYGNSRPFQTEPLLARVIGPDYFHDLADNIVYNRGVMMNLVNSPSYPSGHTTYGYTGAVVLAVLVPERYSEMMVRAAEYGNDRIIIGAHYAMDVIAGRTLALYDMAHLLANDPKYVGQSLSHTPVIKDFQDAMKRARLDTIAALQAGCGGTMVACADQDIGRMNNAGANGAFYASTLTYGLPVVYPRNSGGVEDVSKLAPEAGYLLTAAFPSLTLEQANRILTETEGPGGGFLDSGSSFGVYSRLNLHVAAKRAAHTEPTRQH